MSNWEKPSMFPHHCTIVGCVETTSRERWDNPRDRWIINLPLTDENNIDVLVSLCPRHARELLNLDEDWYQTTERSEKFVREQTRLPESRVE